jgi:Zn-finger nucleic acid-binding protein
VELARVAYEKHTAYQCPECRGYLVTRTKVSLIKSSRDRSTEALEEEASGEQRPDSSAVVPCPKCLGRNMTKRKIRIRQPIGESFSVDVCRHCRVIWFDGGELARLQLDYEQRPKAADELSAQQRRRDRTAEERKQLEELLAALPRSESFIDRALGELTWFFLAVALLVGVGVCYAIALPVGVTIAASVACGAVLGWFVLRIVRATGPNIAVVALLVLALEVLWVAFLLGAFAP